MRHDGCRRQSGRDGAAQRLQPIVRALVAGNVGGVDRQRGGTRHGTGPDRAVGAGEDLGRERLAAGLLVFEEQRLGRHRVAGAEDETVALETVDGGERQPA